MRGDKLDHGARRDVGAGGVKTVQWLGWSLWGLAGMFAVEVYAAVQHFVFVEGTAVVKRPGFSG